MLGLTHSVHATTCFVKDNGIASGSCSTWATACTLGHALSDDVLVTCDTVLVKAGTYGPVILKNAVKVFGGFTGNESLPSQMNPVVNPTVIDAVGAGRAVTSIGHGSTTRLYGFTIKNGNVGGGDYEGGGGILLKDSGAMIVRCIFENNTATWWGGAAAIRGTGSPEFINCDFHNNANDQTIAAGAVFLSSSGLPKFTNCLFYSNRGGEGGAVAVESGTPKFINCTFAANQAVVQAGGGINDQEGTVEIVNSILWSNTAITQGPQLYNDATRRSNVTYTNMQGGVFYGAGNLSADPLFVSGYRLQATSPGKNAGQNITMATDIADIDFDTNINEKIPVDLLMNPRKVDFVVDMGAFEEQTFGGGQ